MTIGDKIKQRRIELGLTQTELANLMGYVSKSSICKIETNVEQNLTAERIGQFAKVLQMSPLELLAPDYEFSLSKEEKELIIEFRSCDVMTRQMVQRLLSYKEGIKNE